MDTVQRECGAVMWVVVSMPGMAEMVESFDTLH
jgi:hypothetical protein